MWVLWIRQSFVRCLGNMESCDTTNGARMECTITTSLLESTFDNCNCEECGEECDTKEIPYEGEIDDEPSYEEVLQMLEELHNKNEEDQQSGFQEGIYDAPENEGNNNVAKFIARAKGE